MNYNNLIFIILLLLMSCGRGAGGSGKSSNQSPATTESDLEIGLDIDAEIDGQYLAVFETLNPIITYKLTGAFTFSRDKLEDELVGDVRLTNAGAGVIHAQNVRTGTRCPTLDDDLNQDGIIDASEGEAIYGPLLFPLDGDLSSQSSHDGVFPVGDIYGNYIYSKVTKFTSFIKDLRSMDNNDGYPKLPKEKPLDIEGRVVVVHGIDSAVELPSSVMSVGRLSRHQSLPIVCGVIMKVWEAPGTEDDGVHRAETNL
jgi:hypothetical protein